MKGYFVSSQNDKFFQSPKFGKVIDYIQKHPKRTALKDSKGKLILICQEVTSLSEAQSILEELSR